MPVTDAMSKLNEALVEILDEAAKDHDFSEALDDAANGYDFDKAIQEAVKNYDFDDAIEEAVGNYDMSEDIEKAVESATEDLDLRDKAEAAVAAAVEEKLPAMVKEAFLKMLEDPDVLEKLSTALFTRPGE
jgi:hypothetical protein